MAMNCLEGTTINNWYVAALGCHFVVVYNSQVKDVERILAGGASKFTEDNSNKAKDDNMGTNASQACLIQ